MSTMTSQIEPRGIDHPSIRSFHPAYCDKRLVKPATWLHAPLHACTVHVHAWVMHAQCTLGARSTSARSARLCTAMARLFSCALDY